MIKARIIASILVITSLVFLSAFLPLGSKAEVIGGGTFEVGQGNELVLAHFIADDLAQVDLEFNVTTGGAIDLLLMDEKGYEAYRLGLNASGLPGSILNQSNGYGSITGLEPGIEYYIVLDNSDLPQGGASSVGSVVVDCSVTGQNITKTSDDLEWIWIILALIFIAFIGIVILLSRYGNAEKGPGSKVIGLGMKYCPKCGEIVGTWVHKCPKCGHEW
jgi:hypothetical protein